MTNQEILAKYLTDMHAVEHHLAHTIKAQLKISDLEKYADANSILKRLEVRSENALTSLEIQIEKFGGNARGGVKDAVTAATGAVLGVIASTRTHETSKALRDDYTTLSLISISYELLHATGNALAAPEVASLCITNLKEVAGFIMEISQSIIPVAVKELESTNGADTSTIKLSQENILNVWKSA